MPTTEVRHTIQKCAKYFGPRHRVRGWRLRRGIPWRKGMNQTSVTKQGEAYYDRSRSFQFCCVVILMTLKL